ncbi:sensor histidine kinase [Pacificispira sp.]|uniref:sensor histidine kinase n=1 Tax=Pacificispira sp. TaxID=2888761 RepID=UPI003BA94B15
MADDRAQSSTIRLARGARMVVMAFLLLTVAAGGFAFLIGEHFHRIERDWTVLGQMPTEKGLLLSRLHDKIGFGGLVHNFKNYVIRGDERYRDMALADFNAATSILNQYESLGVNQDERIALKAIRDTIDKYRTNIDVVDALVEANTLVRQIDQAVRVNDTAMISGLATLRAAWRGTYDSGRNSLSRSVDQGRFWSNGAQIAAALFLAMGCAMTFWILRRERLLSHAVRHLNNEASRFESIVNSGSDGILTVDKHGRIEVFNAAAEKIFGYVRDEAAGMDISALVPADLQEHHRKIIDEIAATSPAVIHFPRHVHGRRKNGSSVPIEINIATYQANGDRHYVASFRDITDRLRAETELRGLKDAAEQASSAKSSFLASMSHELRTPLNAVIGFSEMLRMGELSDKQNEWTGHIHNAGTHLHELVSQILDLAQIERGRLNIRIQAVNIVDIVTECLAQMQPYAQKKQVVVTNKVTTKTEITVYGDPTRLRQCVFNILSNAVKYNRIDGTVTITGLATQDGYYRIAVADTGIGIAPEEHPYVFRMFQRFAEEPDLAHDGAGIGLAVTDQLVRLMGGRLSFRSALNEGSEFSIDIPTTPPSDAESQPSQALGTFRPSSSVGHSGDD